MKNVAKLQFGDIIEYINILTVLLIGFAPFDLKRQIILYSVFFLLNIPRAHIDAGKMKVKPVIFFLFVLMITAEAMDILNVSEASPLALSGLAYIIWFFLSILIYKKYDYYHFLDYYEKCCFFVCICSLIGFSIQLFFPAVIEMLPTINYYGRLNNNIIIYNAIHIDLGYDIVLLNRNCGIAFEPGAFQLIPNMGLAIILSNQGINRNKKYKYFSSLLYIITVVSTTSTTGLVAMLVMLLLKMSQIVRTRKIILAIGAAVGGCVILRSQIEYQLYKMFHTIGGIASRFENTIHVWRNYMTINPFGIGSTNYKWLYTQDLQVGAYDMYTNMYIRYGVIFVILFVYLLLLLLKKNRYVCIALALALLSESLLGIATIPFLYYGLEKNLNTNV